VRARATRLASEWACGAGWGMARLRPGRCCGRLAGADRFQDRVGVQNAVRLFRHLHFARPSSGYGPAGEVDAIPRATVRRRGGAFFSLVEVSVRGRSARHSPSTGVDFRGGEPHSPTTFRPGRWSAGGQLAQLAAESRPSKWPTAPVLVSVPISHLPPDCRYGSSVQSGIPVA